MHVFSCWEFHFENRGSICVYVFSFWDLHEKVIRAIRLPTSILLGWALGQVILKPGRPKNV